jgi:hypothetical protein
MQTLVAEIRVRDPSWIQPVFRVRFSTTVWIGAPEGSAPPDLITA